MSEGSTTYWLLSVRLTFSAWEFQSQLKIVL